MQVMGGAKNHAIRVPATYTNVTLAHARVMEPVKIDALIQWVSVTDQFQELTQLIGAMDPRVREDDEMRRARALLLHPPPRG
jgi:hypothetical protein